MLLRCLKIAMTFGVTSAPAEHSFSSLRRIKTYLRSTMGQEWLTNLSLLYIERQLSGELWNCIDDIVLQFFHRNMWIQELFSFSMQMTWFCTHTYLRLGDH